MGQKPSPKIHSFAIKPILYHALNPLQQEIRCKNHKNKKTSFQNRQRPPLYFHFQPIGSFSEPIPNCLRIRKEADCCSCSLSFHIELEIPACSWTFGNLRGFRRHFRRHFSEEFARRAAKGKLLGQKWRAWKCWRRKFAVSRPLFPGLIRDCRSSRPRSTN